MKIRPDSLKWVHQYALYLNGLYNELALYQEIEGLTYQQAIDLKCCIQKQQKITTIYTDGLYTIVKE
ncbi:hypothetical protein [Bacillus alkalicellulosilyticus]|uniref:hypothetical protein n=1 Tax=Alkalihalobacterium alkalicellulosilyticum TaxID=1912214 RepID=UPI0009966F4D|nr:hypothetical protein [Bacillus alkalicellulosilyticus]